MRLAAVSEIGIAANLMINGVVSAGEMRKRPSGGPDGRFRMVLGEAQASKTPASTRRFSVASQPSPGWAALRVLSSARILAA
ncbi:hypothetical protein GA0070609_0812 [Micromonospora echinaurantiaca]|uniref:Uncharacterized protein n=1 Tax=Micromonospora echinaurantiaca TaxID=47857 RepID=A0A1C5H2A8_9ACTN|nr:hypothetical protein GA0070609_0812 [Micromonospora echinaurantiaca]